MRLPLYSSRKGGTEPHLVGVQADDLTMLATILVCPLKDDLENWCTSLRPVVKAGGIDVAVLCELVRPINRKALVQIGQLDAADSKRVREPVALILAR